MRKFAISDIHGNYDAMMVLLKHVAFDPNKDRLVIIGDLIDRGPDSGRVLKELMILEKKYSNVIVLAGNHEEMMTWYLNGKNQMWMRYGGIEAAQNINEVFKESGVTEVIQWVNALPLTHEDEQFFYAHAGISIPFEKIRPNRKDLWLEKQDFYDIVEDSLFYYTNHKPVIHGHTPSREISFDGVRMNIDLGASVFEEEAKLALVDLTNDCYHAYDFNSGFIITKNIQHNEPPAT